MATISFDADNAGMNDVRAVGMQLKILTGTFDFDTSYPTGGESFDVSNFFPKGVVAVIPSPKSGYVFEYDSDGEKLLAYYAGYDTESLADGALIEVANTTDLAAITDVKFVALGY
jgi:hypothetical protein